MNQKEKIEERANNIFRDLDLLIAPTIFTYLGAIGIIVDSLLTFFTDVPNTIAKPLLTSLLDIAFFISVFIYSLKDNDRKTLSGYIGVEPNSQIAKIPYIFNFLRRGPAFLISYAGLTVHSMSNILMTMNGIKGISPFMYNIVMYGSFVLILVWISVPNLRKKDASRRGPSMNIRLDHSVLHVSDWEVSNRFYAEVMGAEVIARGAGFFYRFGTQQLNLHGPGLSPTPLSRLPVQPGNSDLCFVWDGPIEGALQHLEACGVAVELGPIARFGAQGEGVSVYFRDPDGSLLEFISYSGRE